MPYSTAFNTLPASVDCAVLPLKNESLAGLGTKMGAVQANSTTANQNGAASGTNPQVEG